MITGDTEIKDHSPIEEYTGKLAPSVDKGLMRSVLENDKQTIDHGRLISDSINKGFSSFTPSTLFEHLVKNYSIARNIYGESIIRKLTGYEPSDIQKNIKVPEFQKELIKNIEERFEKLKEEKLIDNEGRLTDKAIDLASLILYTEELDRLMPKGFIGERMHKKEHPYGMKDEVRKYTKDRYRDIEIRKTIRKAIRRSHIEILKDDIVSIRRKSKGKKYIIYGLDASGSMKGKKIEKCKKAGIALAFKAIDEKDKAGLIIFGTDIKAAIPPTDNFPELLKEITKAKATAQTDIARTISESAKLFPNEKATKHLILITDAIPTKGEKPVQDAINEAAIAASENITISIVGIDLNKKGIENAEEIVRKGSGRLYVAKDLEEIDQIVLLDYYSLGNS
ncbi:VWA domain-containing protein [Candidatus Woesearchaeota archaeon]|nr:VWA domain-containing protein [Candidatus Woesearchaeota archaeon]